MHWKRPMRFDKCHFFFSTQLFSKKFDHTSSTAQYSMWNRYSISIQTRTLARDTANKNTPSLANGSKPTEYLHAVHFIACCGLKQRGNDDDGGGGSVDDDGDDRQFNSRMIWNTTHTYTPCIASRNVRVLRRNTKKRRKKHNNQSNILFTRVRRSVAHTVKLMPSTENADDWTASAAFLLAACVSTCRDTQYFRRSY